jgi:hypothetical protein
MIVEAGHSPASTHYIKPNKYFQLWQLETDENCDYMGSLRHKTSFSPNSNNKTTSVAGAV